MTPEKATALAREIFGDGVTRGLRWFLFSNGTVVVRTGLAESAAVATMEQLGSSLGPYEGQASQFGDVNPMPLKHHEKTWLVGYPFNGGLFTFVDEDDIAPENRPPKDEVIQTSAGAVRARQAVGDLQAGLYGRAKRNRDAREPKIVARWSDA